MKTKFYKRLVPIALIASMAVTNVGITSAGAQEIVEAGKSIVAPVVGNLDDSALDAAGCIDTRDFDAIEVVGQTEPWSCAYTLTNTNSSVTDGENQTFSLGIVAKKDNAYKKLYDIRAENTKYFKLVDATSKDEVSGISITGYQNAENTGTAVEEGVEPVAADINSLTVTVEPTAFNDNVVGETKHLILAVAVNNNNSFSWTYYPGCEFIINKTVDDNREKFFTNKAEADLFKMKEGADSASVSFGESDSYKATSVELEFPAGAFDAKDKIDAGLFGVVETEPTTTLSGALTLSEKVQVTNVQLFVEGSDVALSSGDEDTANAVRAKVWLRVYPTAFGEGEDEADYYIAVRSAHGEYKTSVETAGEKTFKLTKESAGDDDESASSSVFQIPGGLTANSKGVTGYKIGVVKAVASSVADADLGDNEIQWDKIVENTVTASLDTTLGEWTGDYNGAKTQSANINVTPVPSASNLVDQYVLYYEDNAATPKRTYVRCLNTAEKTALPLGDYITEAALSTEQKAEVETAILTLLKAQVAISLENENAVSVEGLSKDDADALNAGAIEIPAVSLAKDKALIKDLKFVKACLDKYKSVKSADFNTGITITHEDNDDTKDVTAYTITNEGVTALMNGLEGLKLDDWKKLFEASETDTTGAFLTAVVGNATATYLNTKNAAIKEAGPDLNKIVWVMETTKDSDKSTKINNKDVYPATSSSAKFWGKKFSQKKDKKGNISDVIGTKDESVTKTIGASVLVSNTKAAGKFNSSVYIKGVTKDYVPAKKGKQMVGSVAFTDSFYIPPALPSVFKETTLAAKNKANAYDLKTVTDFDGKDSAKTRFTLSIYAGKSYKLPFKLNDGQDKDLVYEVSNGSKGFTVVNGKVTGTDANGEVLATTIAGVDEAGDNVIKVYSRANPEVYALVQVQVLDAFKSIRANTTSLSVWPGSEQNVVLGTVPAMFGENYKYKITDGTGGKVEIGYLKNSTFTALEDGFIPEGFNTLVVKAKTGQEVAKGSKITVELWTTGATSAKVTLKKDLDIKVNPANAPQDIKTVKTGVKSKETKVLDDDSVVKVVNVPVGGSVNLGYAVNPVAAKASIIGTATDETLPNGDSADDGAVVSVNGDVVTGNAEGTAVVTLSPDGGNISDTFKAKETDNEGYISYFINVYTPGASIAFPETSDYTIKGGFLMSKANADTTCNKDFKASEPITMPRPKTSGGDEEIIWKANNNAAVKFVDDGTDLTITPLQTGTFTITGTTKYTKQSLKFKLNVVADNEAEGKGVFSITKDGKEFKLADAEENTPQDTLYVGEKLNVYFGSGEVNLGGKVKFTSSAPKVAAVNAGGIVTAKSAGDAKITATMTCGTKTVTKTFDITVSPIVPTIKSAKVAAGSVKGKAFKVSLGLNKFDKKTMTLEWYYAGTDGTTVPETKLPGMTDNKLSGSATIAEPGKYKIYAKIKVGSEYPYGAFEVTNTKFGQQEYIKIYETAINGINTNNGDADTKKAIAALGGKYDKDNEKLKVNGRAGGDLYVPLFINEKGSDGKVVKASGTFTGEDFVWTSSNKSLANVEGTPLITENYVGIEENDIIKNVSNASCVAHIKLGQGTGVSNVISGPVTIKGVCKNSNKTVTIKVNVVAGEKALNAAYDPQSLDALETSGVALANVDSSAITDKKPLINGDTAEKNEAALIAKGKTVKEGKSFTMTKYVLVSGSVIKTINGKPEEYITEPETVRVSNGKYVFSFDSANNLKTETVTDVQTKTLKAKPASGTWYLAVADVTYKVTKGFKEVDAEGKNGQDLVLAETGLKVTKIASKTPITKVEPTTPADNSVNALLAGPNNASTVDTVNVAAVPSIDEKNPDEAPNNTDGELDAAIIDGTAIETGMESKTFVYQKYVLIPENKLETVEGFAEYSDERTGRIATSNYKTPTAVDAAEKTVTVDASQVTNGKYYLAVLETKVTTLEEYDSDNSVGYTVQEIITLAEDAKPIKVTVISALQNTSLTNDGHEDALFTPNTGWGGTAPTGTLTVSSDYFTKTPAEGFTAKVSKGGKLVISYTGESTSQQKVYVFDGNTVIPCEFRITAKAAKTPNEVAEAVGTNTTIEYIDLTDDENYGFTKQHYFVDTEAELPSGDDYVFSWAISSIENTPVNTFSETTGQVGETTLNSFSLYNNSGDSQYITLYLFSKKGSGTWNFANVVVKVDLEGISAVTLQAEEHSAAVSSLILDDVELTNGNENYVLAMHNGDEQNPWTYDSAQYTVSVSGGTVTLRHNEGSCGQDEKLCYIAEAPADGSNTLGDRVSKYFALTADDRQG